MGHKEARGADLKMTAKGKTSTAGAAKRRKAAKVRRVAEALEDIYGEPPRPGRDSVIDSLISCILSQNTNDANSGKAWLRLKKRFPTWHDAAKAPLGRIETAIRPGGLAPSKSRRIKAILRRLDDHYGEYSLEFLHEMDDEEAFEFLRGIDGVGAKTAAVVLLFSLARDVFPVDTHIHRLAQRLGFAPEGATRDGVFEMMKPLVPKGKAWSLHITLIRFGRDRCRKRSPLCQGCPLRRECLYVKGKVGF